MPKEQAPTKSDEPVADVPSKSDQGEKIKAELDDLLDEIDEVLESTLQLVAAEAAAREERRHAAGDLGSGASRRVRAGRCRARLGGVRQLREAQATHAGDDSGCARAGRDRN